MTLLLSVISIHPYAFVFGSNSQWQGEVAIKVSTKVGSLQKTIKEHKIKPGNKGRGAEWNWSDIEKRYGIKKGDNLLFSIYMIDNKNDNAPFEYKKIYGGKIKSDGRFGFVINKDMKGKYVVNEDPAAWDEYTPA